MSATGYTCTNYRAQVISSIPMKVGLQNGEPVDWHPLAYFQQRSRVLLWYVTDSTMRNRLQWGHTCDADVGHVIPTTWNGIEYPYIKKAAEAKGVVIDTMIYRLERGYRYNADVVGRGKRVVWNGIEYPSTSAAARALNIPHMTLVLRLKRAGLAMLRLSTPQQSPGRLNTVSQRKVKRSPRSINPSGNVESPRSTGGFDSVSICISAELRIRFPEKHKLS
jgi:hypothetical protein